jgi:hypothetical protein
LDRRSRGSVGRTQVFCRAYGIAADDEVIDAIGEAVRLSVERLRAEGRLTDAEWWQTQLEWLERRRTDLGELLLG